MEPAGETVAGDPDQAIDPASSASPLSAPVLNPSEPAATPTAPPWSPPPCTCCATCSPYYSPVVTPQPSPHVSLDTPVSILDDSEKDVSKHLTREDLRIIWHQRLGHIHSRRVSDMHKYPTVVPNLPIATEIDDCPICLKAKLDKAKRSTSSKRKATQCSQGISIEFAFVTQSYKRTRSSPQRFAWRNVLRTLA
jgi:hypothetical protein